MKQNMVWLLLTTLLLAVLCGCAGEPSDAAPPSAEVETWDPRFVARFSLNQASADRLWPGLQEVDVQEEKNGLQFHIGQVLYEQETQEEEMIHVALDVTFPPETVFPEGFQQGFAETHAQLTPDPLLLLPEKREVQSLEEMEQMHIPQGYTSQLCSVDWETKELRYLLSLHFQEAKVGVEAYTLVLGALSWENEALFEGPVSLSWERKQ